MKDEVLLEQDVNPIQDEGPVIHNSTSQLQSVYNLETKLVEPYYTTQVPKNASCSPPVWIVPSAFGPIREKIVLSTWLR
ncbi:Protein of unknown function D [Prunus dulcis]|uniref:Uncharacterized protein n=1 Tax=Prunus dulcis TaxID=3755 RepID=A0A4Y1QPZ7_PRUDU|nr:Protein of unknown function D [Prunus dulcis]